MVPNNESTLRARLREYFEDYADALDSGALDAWPMFFVPDCTYRVIARDNFDEGLPHATMYCRGHSMMKDRAVAIRETTVYAPRTYRHFLGGIRIESFDGRVLRSRCNFVVFESAAASESRLYLVGDYHDVIEDVDGKLLIRERSCVYDNYRILTSLIFPI